MRPRPGSGLPLALLAAPALALAAAVAPGVACAQTATSAVPTAQERAAWELLAPHPVVQITAFAGGGGGARGTLVGGGATLDWRGLQPLRVTLDATLMVLTQNPQLGQTVFNGALFMGVNYHGYTVSASGRGWRGLPMRVDIALGGGVMSTNFLGNVTNDPSLRDDFALQGGFRLDFDSPNYDIRLAAAALYNTRSGDPGVRADYAICFGTGRNTGCIGIQGVFFDPGFAYGLGYLQFRMDV
jgi:hypothetical protein